MAERSFRGDAAKAEPDCPPRKPHKLSARTKEKGSIRTHNADTRLSRSQRITDSRVIGEAFEQRHSYHGRYMVLWLRSGDNAALRLGVVASKRTGRAVERSKAKRRLREAYRLTRDSLNGDYDLVLTAKRGILQATAKDVEKELITLSKKAGIFGA